MRDGIKGRIFLVGCPRSGTTLLQSLIAAYPEIASWPESHLFVKAGLTRWRWQCIQLGIATPELRRQLIQFLGDIGQAQMQALVPRHGFLVWHYTRAFVDTLDAMAINQGSSFWLEKTPGHLHYIRPIERHIPGVQFIHIVRNGADVVASLYEVTRQHPQAWGGAYAINQCIARWNQDIQITQRYAHKHNHLVVQYQQMINAPASVLKEICSFIGIPFRSNLIAEHRTAAQALILENEPWKHAVRGDIRETSKFERLFDAEQRAYILRRLVKLEAVHVDGVVRDRA